MKKELIRKISINDLKIALTKLEKNNQVDVEYESLVVTLTPYVYGRFSLEDKDKDENITWLMNAMQSAGYEASYDREKDLFCIQKH